MHVTIDPEGYLINALYVPCTMRGHEFYSCRNECVYCLRASACANEPPPLPPVARTFECEMNSDEWKRFRKNSFCCSLVRTWSYSSALVSNDIRGADATRFHAHR